MEHTSIEPIKKEKQTQVCERDYNGIVKGLLVFFLATSAINSVSKLVTNLTWGNTTLGIIMFLCEAACCYFIYVMLKKKSWGLLALFGMLLLQIPSNLILDNPNMESVYISTFMRIGIFSLLLLIPKNKVTGWGVLFGKKSQEDDAVNDKDIIEEDSAEAVVMEDNQPLVEAPSAPALDNDTDSLDAPKQEFPSDTEEMITPIEVVAENPAINQVSSVKAQKFKKQVVLPLWAVITTIALLLIIIGLFAFNIFSKSSSGKKRNPMSDVESTIRAKPLDYPSIVSEEKEWAYSDEDLERNRSNIARAYEIYIEEHYPKIADNIKEFTSMLSQKTIRKRVHSQIDMDYDMDEFEDFEKIIYPATKEHLDKELDRKWLYDILQKAGIVVGSYDTFTTLICEDSNLEYYYREGIKLGLELGSYEEFVEQIK